MNELIAIQALIAASQAKIAAMQTANASRLSRGLSEAYDENEFWAESTICEELYVRAMNIHIPQTGA